MENKQMDDQLVLRIKEALKEKVPEPEIVNQKMENAYKQIRERKAEGKGKVPITVKFSAVAALLMLAMIYCVKNPAFAAQLPLIGNIFRELEGRVSYPGDYSKNSIPLPVAANDKEKDAAPDETGSQNSATAPDQAGSQNSATAPDQADGKDSDAEYCQAKSGGITVTLSEVSYDDQAIYLAILVQNEEGFAQDARLQDQLDFDCQMKLYKADGSADEFSDENGISMLGYKAEGAFSDSHIFKGIAHFSGESLDVSEYVACELTFCEFRQQLTTGELKTVVVPDYGETSMMEFDWAHYPGNWNFHFDLDGFAASKQEITVNDANAQGFGIEKVIKTQYEMYAVPILPEGEEEYDYMITIWDADGEQLEYHGDNFRRMNFYGRDISEVTVYLLRWEDFCESKGSNSYLQPSKAIYQTTVRFED